MTFCSKFTLRCFCKNYKFFEASSQSSLPTFQFEGLLFFKHKCLGFERIRVTMERPLSTVASMPSDRTLPSGLRTARLATVSRLLKSGAPSQTHRRSRSATSLLVARTVVSGTRTCCQLSPRKTANEKKTHKARWTFNVYHPRGCILLALCECARAQREAAWECICCVAGVLRTCGKLGFCFSKEFLACLRGLFSCSAVSSIQLEVIPVPRILVAVVRQVFFSWSVVWVPQISHWKFLGPESRFLWTQGECSFLWRKKEREDGFVPGEGERGSDKGATTVGRLTTLLSCSIKTRWRNNEFARSRRGGDDRNDGTVCGFGGFIGLSDGSPVACSSVRASARSCGASNQSRIHHRPRHSICHVVHGACVDVHYPSSWCYPLLSFLERWCRGTSKRP